MDMENLVVWGIFLLDFLISATAGYMHGGVLGYFVGILNTVMLLLMLVLFGMQIGKAQGMESMKKWNDIDDKMTKEDTGL